jgi:hypothetical protein
MLVMRLPSLYCRFCDAKLRCDDVQVIRTFQDQKTIGMGRWFFQFSILSNPAAAWANGQCA